MCVFSLQFVAKKHRSMIKDLYFIFLYIARFGKTFLRMITILATNKNFVK
jgi:hypothetical protein